MKLALGCMGMSGVYGKTDDAQSIAVIHAAGDNAAANAKLVANLQDLAQRWSITASQLAIGYVLARQPQFVPTLGMRTMQQLDEAVATRPLTAAQLAEVEAVAPRGAVAGTRYPVALMSTLDSEQR